jgi:HEAT repeat protein
LWLVTGRKEESIAIINAELKSPDTDLRVAAARTLLQIPGQSAAALPVLQEILESRKAIRQRCEAVRALGAPGVRAHDVVPLLRQTLRNKESILSDEATKVLGDLGFAAREAAPDLIPILNQRADFLYSSPSRRQALRALLRIDPGLAAKVAPR